jgi:hypothetical protein
MTASAWDPVDAEMRLRALDAALDVAVTKVKDARDKEVGLWRKFRDARSDAMLSPDCPKVSRGGYTTGERDAWVEREVLDAEAAYKKAIADRENAVDEMFKLKDQAAIVGKLSDLVRLDYVNTGRRP